MTVTIEFFAPAGKSFSAQKYNAVDGTTVGTAISVGADSPATRYRFSTTGTGIILVVATATNLRVSGYVNLDKPDANGVCRMVDSYESATATTTFNVLPGTDRGIDRGARGQIIVLLQEEITISRSVVDANGSPVDLRSLTLEFVIEDARGNAVATVADADLSVGGTDHNSYSFTVPAAASAKLGTFEYALNDTGNKANLALGDWIVKRRAVS